MLNIISTCWDILCVDINVDKRCVDHSTSINLVLKVAGNQCYHIYQQKIELVGKLSAIAVFAYLLYFVLVISNNQTCLRRRSEALRLIRIIGSAMFGATFN